jgi:hypothetical protein
VSNKRRGLWAWIKSIFTRLKTPRMIIEIEKGVPTQVDREALASLQGHPGITALINKLRLQRQYMEAQLIKDRHETLRDADILQLGIYWTRFVESQIEQAIGTAKYKARPMVEDEVEEFQRARSAIESVRPTRSEN